MNDLKWIEERLNDLAIDVKSEILIADLLDYGIDVEDIVVSPTGTGKRAFGYDLLNARWTELESGKELLFVYITREGLYDALPQGLFHQPKSLKLFRTTTEMVAEVKRAKEEEIEVRKFFLPIEQEFFWQKIAVELQERQTLEELKENKSSDIYSDFWDLDDCFDAKQKSILLNVLPLTHKIVGNFELTSECFEMVLGTKVKIESIDPVMKNTGKENTLSIGQQVLGVNAVLGSAYNDGDPAVQISIGPLSTQLLSDFIPGGKGNKVLDALCSFFIPVDLDIQTKVMVEESSFGSVLNSRKEGMRLGFNVSLDNSKKSKLKYKFA